MYSAYPTPKVRGGDREREAATVQEREAATVQERPRGATPRPRSGVVAKKNNPMSEVSGHCQEEEPHVQGAAAVQHRRAKRSYSTFKGRLAVKRYPTSKVSKTQVRW